MTGGRIVTPDRVIEGGHVVYRGERILAVGPGPAPIESATDVNGRLVLPGFVDLHGDELERHRAPRRGARVPTTTALVSADRANVAAGITTKFHAVAFEEAAEDGRSLDGARSVVEAVESLECLLADTRIHARCEVGEQRSIETVIDALGRGPVGLVSVMNHHPNDGQFEDRGAFERRYPDGDRALEGRRETARAAVVPGERRVVAAARAAGVPTAVHDLEEESRTEAHATLGVELCEFPLTLPVARTAHERGMTVVMGAPNLVRGGSLWGNLSASRAATAGVVDVLSTDFHPPSLLESVLVDTGEPLPRRVRRVSATPARSVGLSDRGRLETGARADLIVVEPGPPPRVVTAVVGGETVVDGTG